MYHSGEHRETAEQAELELALGTAALLSAGTTRLYASSLLPSVTSVAIGRGAPEVFPRSRGEVVRAAPDYDAAEIVTEDEGVGALRGGGVVFLAVGGRESAWVASGRRSTQRSMVIAWKRSDAIGDSLPGISGDVVGGVQVVVVVDAGASLKGDQNSGRGVAAVQLGSKWMRRKMGRVETFVDVIVERTNGSYCDYAAQPPNQIHDRDDVEP
ncbi:hypothetical protein EDB86DRAFT_2830513 [Lactarius hatsudake]|nr:hypothetical protein EDB86DRAFT_2830513 [Lactarius hatsudake]